ncbi:MAG TPA: sigma-70 family RNA polymerase sigma factor [Acidiferrobacterales bacterium]|jgi:RNA polymerase sigma-70 factor (ECF subfamily)
MTNPIDFLSLFGRSRELKSALEQSRARLYRVAYAWCHNAALADDLVQDTLTKAMQKSAQLRDPKARDAWLFSILTNCYRDHFRRQRDMDDIDELELAQDGTPETENSQLQIIEKVRAAVARLPEGQRQVVTLVDLEGFSYIEVAAILDVPIGTVMSRLCRARNAMKSQLLREFGKAPDAQGPQIRRIK